MRKLWRPEFNVNQALLLDVKTIPISQLFELLAIFIFPLPLAALKIH